VDFYLSRQRQAVTTSGFRLAARSCDSHPGLSGFNWLAIGPVK